MAHVPSPLPADAYLAAIIESSDDAIVSKDLNGIVTSWNPAAERLFEFTADEMIGQSITKIIPKERLGEEDTVLSRIRSGRRVDHFETVRQTKSGRLIEVSLTVSPVRDASGRVIGASKVARDITERKRLLEAQRLAQAAAEAARREALEAENQRIQEASRVKTAFVANMSHELRTPLNSIIGFAELIADERFGTLPPKYRDFAATMVRSGRHLLQLINDILDLAKVESGRIDLRPERIDLQSLVDEACATVAGLAAARRIHIDVEVDAAIGRVYLDPGRLKQVLYNYLSNAIKFTAEGGRVTIRVAPESASEFRLEVIDCGIGIAPDDLQRLFVDFQQLDSSTTKRHAGTGLGLALTRRIVEAQDGRVGVYSAVGVGSTFWATLPRSTAARSADVTGSEPADVANVPR